MATAGDGAASYEGGGAGGKFRKLPFRRSRATPYDRPPTAVRSYSRSEGGGWLSKLIVDPASKLISSGANVIFNSVFRKRLPPTPPLLPPPPASKQASSDRCQKAVTNTVYESQELALDGGSNPSNHSDDIGISEIEQMLKEKTFTRSEIDRLKELLHARVVDLPSSLGENRIEAKTSKSATDIQSHEDYEITPIQENTNGSGRFDRISSTLVVSSRVIQEDVASPAEVAKAYMHSRNSKVLPSVLGLHGTALREDTTLNNIPFTPKSPILPLAPKSSQVGAFENGFVTPRSRGRTAIYSMARTPYLRIHPNSTSKGLTSATSGYSGRSSLLSRFALENDGQIGSKQLDLKRRSSVLNDDTGSVGPIRNIRQKSNLLSQESSTTHGLVACPDFTQHPTLSTPKLLLDVPRNKFSKNVRVGEDNSTPSTSYAAVPSKSTETATKILQQLEKLTPKEKSSQSKPVVIKDKSPLKLTTNMLSGQALRSLEDVDSLKLLQNRQDNLSLEDHQASCLTDTHDSTSQKQAKVEANGPKKLTFSNDVLTPAVTTTYPSFPRNDALSNDKTGHSVSTVYDGQPPQKQRAFQMSAHEDSLELDDDVHCNGPASLAEGREQPETSVVESKALPVEVITVDNSSVLTHVQMPEDCVLPKKTDWETSDKSTLRAKGIGVAFAASPTSHISSEPTVCSETSSAFNKLIPSNEESPAPPFNFSSKNDKVPPAMVSLSSSPLSITSGPKSTAWSDPKAVGFNSVSSVASCATDTQWKVLESVKGDNKTNPNSGEVVEKQQVLTSSVSTSTSSSFFSFGAPADSLNLKNGPVASTTASIVSATAPLFSSSGSATLSLTNSSSAVTFSSIDATVHTTSPIAVASITSNDSLSASSAAPTFSFKFGASSIPTAGEITGLKTETVKEASSNNPSTSPFGGTSFTTGSTGSSAFGFGSSLTSSNSNNQVSLFGSVSGSLVNAQAPLSGSGLPAVTQSTPVQFGLSGASSVFGTSGSAPFTSGSSVFGSSASASKPLSLGPSFGSNSSAITSETNSVSTGTGATPSMFTFALSSAASSSGMNSLSSSNGGTSSAFTFGLSSTSSAETNAVSSSSAATKPFMFGSALSTPSPSPSSGFSFGASSTAVTATNTSPMVFGSSTGALSNSPFSFTATTASASPLPSVSQTQPVFGNSTPVFGASPGNGDQMNMEDSMAEDPVQASTLAPAVPTFGQPAMMPPSGFVFGSAAPFQFGSQPNQATPQNPFQASSSLGGSFSLGSGGGDKSARKLVRINRNRNRKK